MTYTYKGRAININQKLLDAHEALYREKFPEWRADNYIQQELKCSDDIENAIYDIPDDIIENIISNGLKTEIKANSLKAEDITCSIRNPALTRDIYGRVRN